MMDFKQEILDRLNGTGSNQPVFMPDLTLWYQWHLSHDSLPEEYKGKSLIDICADLNTPAWIVNTPWRLGYQGIEVERETTENKRVARYRTSKGTLTEAWSLGPDGDWWKIEYPVKNEKDIDAFEEVVSAMTYTVENKVLTDIKATPSAINVSTLPQSPYSDMLHNHLGWSDGLMLMMGSEQDRLDALLKIMEEKRQHLIKSIADSLSPIVLAPDNLDGQYVSPGVFEDYLEESYEKTVSILHNHNKKLIVHIGGFSKHLLPLLPKTGVDGLSGISGPPQSNADLRKAREIAGPEIVLWGGIPQDFMISARAESDLTLSTQEAMTVVTDDSRMIIGIADHVPVDTDISRLKKVARQINGDG